MVGKKLKRPSKLSQMNKPSNSKAGRSKPPAESHVYVLVGQRVNLTPSGNASKRRYDGFHKAYNATYTLFDETDEKELLKSGTMGDGFDTIDMLEGRKNIVVLLQQGEKGIVKKSTHKGIGWILISD